MAGNSRSGARKKPTQMKIIQGTARADRTNANEPKPEFKIPEPPPGLTPKQVEYYHDFSEKIHGMRIMTEVDHYAVASLAKYWDQWMIASHFIEENGVCYEYENRYGEIIYKKYPEWNVMMNAWNACKNLLTEFGLTPASRSKVSVTTPDNKNKKKGGNGWQDL